MRISDCSSDVCSSDLAVFAWAFIRFSRWGFQIRAVGSNPEAAAFAGIPVGAPVLRTALLSGGLAGMAGVCELAGLKGYLTIRPVGRRVGKEGVSPCRSRWSPYQ